MILDAATRRPIRYEIAALWLHRDLHVVEASSLQPGLDIPRRGRTTDAAAQ